MNEILERNLPALKKMCADYNVKSLYVFGSVLTDRFSEKSDLDFIVSFTDNVPLLDYADNFFDFRDDLSRLLGRRIDLVEESTLSNPYFINEVNHTKQYIYGR